MRAERYEGKTMKTNVVSRRSLAVFAAIALAQPVCFLTRATVESGAVAPLAVTKIQDPSAVEPWGVAVLAFGGRVAVANYVSDNVTIINTADNSFQNVALFDPRACATCGPPLGPFGVVGRQDGERIYVTLFGSNVIPSKEFPIDYEAVLGGRVAVLTKQENGTYAQTSLVGVGKGPRIPTIVGPKLFVPCSGENRVDVIDTGSEQKIAEIPVGQEPSSCVASLDLSKVYVTNFGDGTISVINPRTNQRVKDIPVPRVVIPTPVGSTEPPAAPLLAHPWTGAVSVVNGNLYVAYWGTVGDVFPNGAIAVFDTCKDEFVRATLDDQTRGTPPGSPGATGIPAPTAPLIKDATGKTPGAGGGGGGPFGVASCPADPQFLPSVLFTNDGIGIAGAIDARIDQTISIPPIAGAACAKPRGVACANVGTSPPSGAPLLIPFTYVACGQPDNSVLVFRAPEVRANYADLVYASISGNTLRFEGNGFQSGVHIELSVDGKFNCLSFAREPKIKKGGTLLVQKGRLSDGSKLGDDANEHALIRLVDPDGTVRLPTGVGRTP
jgi:YVTN family beta-propeller protein